MISFWVNAEGRFGIDQYMAQRDPGLAERIRVRTYEGLTAHFEADRGAHLFTALDQLTDSGLETVVAIQDQLSERSPADLRLNDPRKVARRFELLARMHAAGINGFRARRATESLHGARFPVFVREESGHGGAMTKLLTDPGEVASALLALRARGRRTADLMVVEFCDLSDSEGVFRTASAYKVGELIVPAFLTRGRHFMLKWHKSEHDERAMQEFVDYVESNPHKAWLRRVFALAGVDYGRIDYGIGREQLQVWEINLNPTLGPSGSTAPAPLAAPLETMLQHGRGVYIAAMRRAFQALDPERAQGRVPIRLDPGLLAQMRTESARARRRHAAVRLLQRIYSHPAIGKPLRAIYSWLLPRR